MMRIQKLDPFSNLHALNGSGEANTKGPLRGRNKSKRKGYSSLEDMMSPYSGNPLRALLVAVSIIVQILKS
jgi:hypothetical protein